MSAQALESLRALKDCSAGQRVTFQARVLRLWDVGGLRMCLVGDDSALMRVEIAEAGVLERKSYEFRDALVRQYPGGWHSATLDEESRVVPLDYEVQISQDEEYIERTFKILSGVQRKKGRAAGRLGPWRHPSSKERGGE